jgi:two-component system, sporulation sensor kinase A
LNTIYSIAGTPGSGEYHILERIAEALVALDEQWRYTHVNIEACRLLERSPEQLLGVSIWDAFPSVRKTALVERYENAMETKQGVKYRDYYPPLESWFEIQIYPSDSGLTIFFRDVTQEQNDKLKFEQHYQSLFEGHPDAVCCLDMQGCFVSVNSAMTSLTGYAAEELLHREAWGFVTPVDEAQLVTLRKQIRQGKSVVFETKIRNRQGSIVHLLATGIPIMINGAMTGVYVIAKNITRRKNAEEALRRSERVLKESQRVAKVGSWEFHFEENASYWTDEIFRIYGMEPRPGPVKFEEFSKRIHPDDLDRVKKTLSRAAEGEQINLEYRIVLPDGSIRTVISQRSMTSQGDQPQTMLGVIQDITERKNTEEMLHKSDKLSVVGQLAAAIAHEIRNPLTAVKGFIRLIQREPLDIENMNRYFDIVTKELDRIEWITGELLLLSKPQASRRAPVDISLLLSEVSILLSSEALMRKIQIVVDAEESGLTVYGETIQLKQAFVNILKNAIESMDHGGTIRITASRREQDAIVIDVQDEGSGIPEERIPRLGEPFYTTKERGTGLGLMITLRIVDAHQGKVDIQSEFGKGTKVSVAFPAINA